MLNTTQIKPLKQVNISVDAEETKQRAKQVWKSAKNATKDDLVALAGCSKATVYRVYDTGSISIKLAIAFGQAMNINPYYLTGETDEAGEFSEALLLQILEQHGYKKLIAELAPIEERAAKPKRKPRKQKTVVEVAPEPEVVSATESEPEVVAELEQGPQPDQSPAVVEDALRTAGAAVNFSEEQLQALIHAQVLLSDAGIATATDKLALIKGILIS